MGSALLSTVGGRNGAQGHGRWSLLPLLGASWMALNSGPWVPMAVVVLLICLTCAGRRFVLRRMQFRDQA